MFTDMKEALAVEDLELTPLGSGQEAAAALVVAYNARDKEDHAYLLGALGLPCGEDDLTRLLPHLTTPDTPTTGVPMTTVNAFTATAVSMLRDGSSPDHVRSTLGLSDSELAEAAAHADQTATTAPAPAPDASTSAPQTAVPIADRGIPAQVVLDAYDAAHPTTHRAEAS